MAHTYDPIERAGRKQAKAELEQPHTPPISVIGLRDRVDRIEKIIGIKES